MTRSLSIAAALLAVTTLVVFAQANPLSQIKESANNTRDAAEQKSADDAKEAERHETKSAPAEKSAAKERHGEHAGHEHQAHDMDAADHRMLVANAVAVMIPTEGNDVTGVVTFAQSELGVTVTAVVHGLEPGAQHGFHIHEYGDLSDPAGKAAGGHYNPEGHDHALPTNGEQPRHAGDLGNLEADSEGNATYSMTFENISIAGTKNPILGRGVIIHAQPDDGGQPTGNAGDRIAQGVIGVAKPVE